MRPSILLKQIDSRLDARDYPRHKKEKKIENRVLASTAHFSHMRVIERDAGPLVKK